MENTFLCYGFYILIFLPLFLLLFWFNKKRKLSSHLKRRECFLKRTNEIEEHKYIYITTRYIIYTHKFKTQRFLYQTNKKQYIAII